MSVRLQGVWIAFAASIVTLIVCWERDVSHDIAWYLIATQKWLRGAELYADIIEINPPLIFYLTVPSIVISDIFPVSLENAFHTSFAALIFFSFYLTSAVLAKQSTLQAGRSFLFLTLMLVIVLVFPGQDIGQRDHLFVVFALPWLLHQAISPELHGRVSQIPLALFASVGICLKPHFLFLPIFVTIALVLQTRSWRPIVSPSNWVFAATGAFYVGYVALVHPAYFDTIVPLARSVYGAYTFGAAVIIEKLIVPSTVLVVLLMASARKNQHAARMFSAAAIAGLFSFVVQWTGFEYQVIPLEIVSAVGLAWIVIHDRRVSLNSIAVVLLLCAALSINLRPGFRRDHVTDDLIAHIGPRRSVMTFSSDLVPGPAVAFGANAAWTSRYPALWLVPGAVNRLDKLNCLDDRASCEDLNAILDMTRGYILEDLIRLRPDVMIFDQNAPFFERNLTPFDWSRFMSERAEYAHFMMNYHHEQTTDRFQIWALNK